MQFYSTWSQPSKANDSAYETWKRACRQHCIEWVETSVRGDLWQKIIARVKGKGYKKVWRWWYWQKHRRVKGVKTELTGLGMITSEEHFRLWGSGTKLERQGWGVWICAEQGWWIYQTKDVEDVRQEEEKRKTSEKFLFLCRPLKRAAERRLFPSCKSIIFCWPILTLSEHFMWNIVHNGGFTVL